LGGACLWGVVLSEWKAKRSMSGKRKPGQGGEIGPPQNQKKRGWDGADKGSETKRNTTGIGGD